VCPRALHLLATAGIQKQVVFAEDFDRNNFLDRLGTIIDETDTHCLAWALLPNHFHVLLNTGRVPIATVMRRIAPSGISLSVQCGQTIAV